APARRSVPYRIVYREHGTAVAGPRPGSVYEDRNRISLRGEPDGRHDLQPPKGNAPDAQYTDGGLRSFFVYRDTGINSATNGKLRVQLVRAARKSSEAKGGTGVHFSYRRYPRRLHAARLGPVRL